MLKFEKPEENKKENKEKIEDKNTKEAENIKKKLREGVENPLSTVTNFIETNTGKSLFDGTKNRLKDDLKKKIANNYPSVENIADKVDPFVEENFGEEEFLYSYFAEQDDNLYEMVMVKPGSPGEVELEMAITDINKEKIAKDFEERVKNVAQGHAEDDYTTAPFTALDQQVLMAE